MNVFFLSWARGNQPIVWNGTQWLERESAREHWKGALLLDESMAELGLPAMRARFPLLSIEIVRIDDPPVQKTKYPKGAGE